MGNRIAKHVKSAAGVLEKSTYYILDAQGNQLAMYEYAVNTTTVTYTLKERNIYGSSLLGVNRYEMNMFLHVDTTNIQPLFKKQYTISNHLGNVLTVFSDKKVPILSGDGTTVIGYNPTIISTSDYSPFGVELNGRTSVGSYRYGYNGMELDNEVSGQGNSYTTEFRQYDPRLGRWKSMDPLMAQFPWQSPYCSMDNNPISLVDPTGQAAEDGENEDWYKNQNGEVQYFEDMTQESFTEDLAIYNPLNNKLENAGSNQWTKTDHVPNKDEVPVSSQTSLIPEFSDELSFEVDLMTTLVTVAAESTASTPNQYLEKGATSLISHSNDAKFISKTAGTFGTVFTITDQLVNAVNYYTQNKIEKANNHIITATGYGIAATMMAAPTGVSQIAGAALFIGITLYDVFTND